MSKTEDSRKDRKFILEPAVGIVGGLLALLTAIIGCIAAIIGSPQLMEFFLPASPTPIINASTPIIITSTPVPPEITQAPGFTPTPLVILVTEIVIQTPVQTPRMYGFTLCSDDCNGANAMTTRLLPERTKKVYAQWQYENIPTGADYTRTWSMNGVEWIRYHCSWPGPGNGTFSVALSEPAGLRSGIWMMTITVNGEVLLREQIEVQGNWEHWDPAGSFEKCR